jgi:HD-GYP domain-containing protein (c-di-GMP phosphodiesterase class II)
LEKKNLELKYIQYLQTIPEGKLHYINSGFYKYKAFYKLKSDYGYRYVTLNLDYANSRNIFFSIITLIGFVPILILFLIRRFIIKETDKIIKPVKKTAETMKEYTKNDYNLNSSSIIDSEIQEISQIKNEFLNMAKKIKISIIEQENTNSELEELYENNELLIKKINRLIKLTVDSKKYENLEEFLKYLFDNIFDFIPEADYGSLSIIRNGKRYFIDTKGHNLDILKKIDLNDGLFIEEKEIKIIDDIIEFDKQSIPKYSSDLFIEASKPIKSTLIIPFNANGVIYGNMNLDIDKFSEKSFNQESIRFSKFFSDIITSYIILSEYQNLDSKYKESMIKSIINLVEIHDTYTKGHSNNVSKLALEFAQKLNLNKDRQFQIYWAALIHDMGKIVIPYEILNKPTKLTSEEYEEIKKHPIYAYEVLKDIDNMKDIAKYIRHHHERVDGNGYPDGLTGEEIPFESKLISICDAYDAMTSKRSYKRELSKEKAIEELIKNKRKQFDEKLVDDFINLVLKE